MENWFIGLVVAEIIIILVVIIIKIIIQRRDAKTVDKVLKYFEERALENNNADRFEECVKIIKENQKK